MRLVNRDGEGENYQINKGVKAVYDDKQKKLASLTINDKPVKDSQYYIIAIQGFHFNSSSSYLNLTQQELMQSGKSKVITTSAQEALKEFLRNNQNINRRVEGRLLYI